MPGKIEEPVLHVVAASLLRRVRPWLPAPDIERLAAALDHVLRAPALAAVVARRAKQVIEYPPAHDDILHGPHHDLQEACAVVAWPGEIGGGPAWAHALVIKRGEDARSRMVDVAAMAIAEVERLDRVSGNVDSAAEVPTDATAAGDTPDGFDRAPDRYSGQERETIDRMRDRAFAVAEKLVDGTVVGYGGPHVTRAELVSALADGLFAYHCEATAMKYEDRRGRKGDAAEDDRKAMFYRRMAAHVRGAGPDPRHQRPGFVPYRRAE